MMMNALRMLMFSLFLVAFLPLFMAGMVGFMVRLKTRNRGISATAYEPLFNRLGFHHAGTRDDARRREIGASSACAVADCVLADHRDNGTGG